MLLAAQRAALVALGLQPMWFPTYYKNSDICGASFNYLFESDHPVWWQPQCYDNCWYIDALTIDPHKLVDDCLKGIWDKSAGPPPEIFSNVAKANVGTLPRIMVYIACHKEHGTRAFFLFNGATHGGKKSDKTKKGRMYEDFKFWYSDLTDAQLRHVKEMSYYSSEGTLNKCDARVGKATRDSMLKDPFDPMYFLVRALTTTIIIEQLPPRHHLFCFLIPKLIIISWHMF